MRRLRSVLATLAVAAFLTSAAHAAGEVYKWTDANGVVHYTDARPEGTEYEKLNVRGSGARAEAPAPEAEVPAEAPKPAKPTAQSNCEIARRNLETFETSQNIAMDRDGDGTPEPLGEAERAAEIERNRELVKIYCG